MFTGTRRMEVNRHLYDSLTLFYLLRGFWESKSHSQHRQQAPLLTELSRWPSKYLSYIFFLSTHIHMCTYANIYVCIIFFLSDKD